MGKVVLKMSVEVFERKKLLLLGSEGGEKHPSGSALYLGVNKFGGKGEVERT